MPLNLESLSDAARTALLARIAHTLTIRAYNELLHRVTGSVVSHLSGSQGYSLPSMVEMIRSFGIHHKRVGEMDWALQNALQSTETKAME